MFIFLNPLLDCIIVCVQIEKILDEDRCWSLGVILTACPLPRYSSIANDCIITYTSVSSV